MPKWQNNFTEIALWHGSSPVNLMHIFRTSFLKNTSGRLLLKIRLLYLYTKFQICLKGSILKISYYIYKKRSIALLCTGLVDFVINSLFRSFP